MRAFLDIDIGDADAHASASAAYERSAAFLQEAGAQLGIASTSSLRDDLDEEQVETLREAYEANPKWADKGAFCAAEPAPLRAGRIVVELFEKEVCVRLLCGGDDDDRQRL